MQKIEYSTIPFFNGSGSGHSQLPANSMDDHLAYGSIQSVAIKIFESQCLKGTGNMTSAAKIVLRTDEKKMEWPLCHFPTKCLGAQALHLQTLSIKMKDRVTEGTLELPLLVMQKV